MLVVHSQKDSQPDWREREIVADIEKGLCKSAGNTSYSIPTLPSKVGMRDYCLVSLFSLGEATSIVRKTSHKFIYRYKNWTLVTAL